MQAIRERDHIQRLLDDKIAHSDQLLRESTAAQQWLSICDALTESQIISDVEGINYKIGNVASTLSEALISALPLGAPYHIDFPSSFDSFLSSHLVEAFNVVDHRENSTLLEITVQSVLASFASDVSLRWDISNGRLQLSLNQVFESVYYGGKFFKPFYLYSLTLAVRDRWDIGKLESTDPSLYKLRARNKHQSRGRPSVSIPHLPWGRLSPPSLPTTTKPLDS
jgi:hypothetical protein